MPGGRPSVATAAAVTVATLALAAGAASAAPSSDVLVQAPPALAADALSGMPRPALPAADVAVLERRAGRPLPELRHLYRARAAGPAAARRLARRLDARAGVEAAVAPVAAPPPAFCRTPPPGGWPAIPAGQPTPDLSGFQDYRAGLGIPAGATGAGVAIGDVEYQWRPEHEDLAGRALPASPDIDSGVLDPRFQALEHGTAVLGILGAAANGLGVTGLAPAAEVTPTSPFAGDPSTYDLLGATVDAATGLQRGDVLLVEQQTSVPVTTGSAFAPVEAVEAMRNAIRAIVNGGIVVVEPAGNGDRDLATLGVPWLADPASPDGTGALMVGAGNSPVTGTDLARTAGTNFGARVNLQGYGSGVLTSGYGDLDPALPPSRGYTACFDGTSSASATVAGAVAALQDLAERETGGPLTPAATRAAMVATGTSPSPPSLQHIGPRPNVAAAAALVSPAEPPTGAAPTPPPPAAAPPVAPAPPPAVTRPAARGAIARLNRRAGTLTIILRGLAPRPVAFIGPRRLVIAGGRVVLPGVRPRHFVLVVAAPARGRVRYTLTSFRVTVRKSGPVRVVRL